jgi:signal transduction histidine kinase
MEKIRNLNFLDTLLPLAVIVFIICLGVVLLNQQFQKNLFRQRAREDALKSEHQQDLLRANIEAGEQQRKRVAHDLHDELGAVLSIMRMNLVLLEQQNAGGAEELTVALQNARMLSETAMASVRSISHQLMPPQLESFGLIVTLESVISQITAMGRLLIRLTAPSPLGDLSWTSTVGLYRIIMELINNTIKHAEATEITIAICRAGDFITCRYTDNGQGLPADTLAIGLGLKGIQGRVSALCGKYEMGNAMQGGFYATIQIPADTL